MTKQKTCKTKGCENPVLKGKYCENCKQAHKEKRKKGLKYASIVSPIPILVTIKVGPEKIMEVGKTAVNVILKKL